MKEYIIQLYVNESKCDEIKDDDCNTLKCLDCLGCTALVVTNSNSNNEVINTLNNFKIDKETTSVYHILLETFDEVDDTNFMMYLFNDNSDFRLTDLEDDRILVHFNSEFENFKDLFEEFGYDNINLYNRNYDIKELKSKIRNLKLLRNVYCFLSTSFGVGVAVSIFQCFNGNTLLALLAGVISYTGHLGTFSEFEKNYIDVKVNKRLLKKLDDK